MDDFRLQPFPLLRRRLVVQEDVYINKTYWHAYSVSIITTHWKCLEACIL